MCVCSTAVTTAKADGTLRASLIVSSIILCVCWSIYLLVWGSQFKQRVQPSWRRLWSLIWVNILIQHLEHITSALLSYSNHPHWQTWWKTLGWCQTLFLVSVLVVLQPDAKIKSVYTEYWRSENRILQLLKFWTLLYAETEASAQSEVQSVLDQRFIYTCRFHWIRDSCSCPVWWLWEEPRMFRTASFSDQISDHVLNLSGSPCPWKQL